MRRSRRSRSRSRKNSVYAKSCLINFSLLNTASESKHIIELRCRTPAKAKVIIFMTWKKKKLFEHWSSNCCTNSKWIYTGGKFSKEYFAKKNKRWRWNYLEASFPSPPRFSLLFLQSSKKRNLFLPSSLNWMQFIAFPKLVFHRQWQPMHICLLNVASGANMRKVAGGDAVRGMLTKTNPWSERDK